MIASVYPTLNDFFAACYRPRRLLGCSAPTIKHYAVAIRHLHRFFGRPVTLADLADEDRVAEFMAWFAEGRRPATVATQRSQMVALLTYAHRRGLIAAVPDIPRVSQLQHAPDSYTVTEVARLVNAARDAVGEICGIPASFYWMSNFLIAYDTGVRSRALWSIELPHLRLHIPAIVFPPENMKNRRGQIIRIARSTAAVIKLSLGPRRLLFPEPWCLATRYARAKEFFRAAGLPTGRHDLYQRLRRTTGTMTHAKGGDATAQLGHSSDAVTRQFYLDQSENVQAADLLDHPWANSITEANSQQRLF